jgi:hypothetical protein
MEGLKVKFEIVQGTNLAEVGSFLSPGDGALLSHVEFVLENDFQELLVGSLLGSASLRRNSNVLSSPERGSLCAYFLRVLFVIVGWMGRADELRIGSEIADQRVIVGEGEAILLAWFTDEAFDVFESASAGFQRLCKQVAARFEKERPHLQPLPPSLFS